MTDYKTLQKIDKNRKVRVYRADPSEAGTHFKMQDGTQYVVDKNGSFRRLDKIQRQGGKS